VVAVKLPIVAVGKVVAVSAMSVTPLANVALSDFCHLVTVPVLPVMLIAVLGVVPVQIVCVPALIVPPTLAGSTVIVAVAEFAVAHTEPL
jgi:hypothetical protein